MQIIIVCQSNVCSPVKGMLCSCQSPQWEMSENICYAWEDVAYLFGEFAKNFVYFPNIRFGEGDSRRKLCLV